MFSIFELGFKYAVTINGPRRARRIDNGGGVPYNSRQELSWGSHDPPMEDVFVPLSRSGIRLGAGMTARRPEKNPSRPDPFRRIISTFGRFR